jgi:adenylate kinase
MTKIPVAICFLGSPASGKGTMASKIQEHLGYPSVSPGNIFKSIRDQKTETAELVRESVKDGGLCPTWLTNKIVLEESQRLIESGAKYITLDGFPRTLDQLDFLLENYDIKYFLHSATHYMTMRKLVTHRRSCKDCKAVFSCLNPQAACSKNCNILDSSTWETRWDDTPEFFAKRYQVFKKETEPVILAVKGRSNYIKLDLIKNEDSLKILIDLLK